ncbi:unnamed protein product [Cylicocyclus nassatus]|uniref:DNA pilot protein n=1 Tax=Cylicocyclus nassatus TaxID=53992 RepID=A0AA36DST0_CYLNA|nr:unnamed protein product [Cylicocyclus nassatus]
MGALLSSLAAPLIQAGSGLVGTVANLFMNNKNLQAQKDINQQNIELAREQNRWNEEMIDKANAYNSPEHQRQLLEEAGYNPALFSPEGMTMQAPQSADLANQQMIHNDPAALSGFNQGLNQWHNQATTHLTEEQSKTFAVQIDEMNQKIRQSQEQIILMRQQGKKIDYDIRFSGEQLKLQIKQTSATIQKIMSDIGVNDATIHKISQEIVNLSQQAILTGKQIESAELNNIYQSIVNTYADESEKEKINSMKASIYNALTSSTAKTVDNFATWLSNFTHNITHSSGYKNPFDGSFDRINRKGGFLNQE